MPRIPLAERAEQAGRSRDRVLDAGKTAALLVVIIAHSLAWHGIDGEPGNVLQVRPDLAWVTWGFQILAVFFAAGAVSNAASLDRSPDPGTWLGRRLRRLLGPVLVYATILSTLLVLVPVIGQPAVFAGRFLAQLLWFAGVYLVVVAAAPWTSRHQGLPLLIGWLAAIAAVDVARLTAVPALGWCNMLLVWGWLHQVGYRLPQLRRAPRRLLLPGAAASAVAALALALLGPYSNAMVSYAGDPEPSNLSPPTLVVALHGLALILLWAALWGPLDRLLRRPVIWTPVAVLGSRGLGLYLWHIPIVGAIAVVFVLRGVAPAPLSAQWWMLHGATALVVIAGGWLLAGAADRALPRLDRIRSSRSARGAGLVTGLAGLLTLLLSVTGLASWWTGTLLGLPSGTPVVLGLLWLIWRLRPAVSPAQPAAASRPAPAA